MKRYSELNPLDKLNELRYQNRKKVKGTSPKSPCFLDHSDNEDEDEDKDDHFIKGKNLLDEGSLEDPRPRETKKKRKAFYEDEDELTDGNADECYLCEDGGNVICCDNCFRSFHSSCLKLHSHPDNNWMCPYCKSLQENAYERCANCTQSLKETENHQRLSCSKCLRRIHWDCIDTPLNLIVDAPINKNFVFSPKIVNELKHGFLKRSEYPKEMIKDLYAQHNFEYLFHICNTCIMNTGIQKIKKNTKQQVGETKRDYYLAKLKRSSDIHAFWLNHFKVEATNPMLLKMFLRKLANENVEEEAEIDDLSGDDEGLVSVTESYRIEKVLAIKKPIASAKKDPAEILEEIVKKPVKKKTPLGNYKFLVKWEDMEYSNVTWEDEFIVTKFKEKIKQYFSIRLKMHELTKQPRKENLPRFVDFDKQPAFIKESLYDYQLKGFKWLVNQYLQRKNAILADEMGLGKTIQTLCFFRYLSVEFGYNGPFLVVAPNSTIYNWQREAQKWCPEYDVVIYVGSAASRKKIMDLEFVSGKYAHSRTNLKPKFQLLITTYMAVNSDVTNLRKVNWEVVVVDEAQRLKNKESKLYSLCDTLRTRFKLLLTGTPIQNSIEELVNLFKYLIPKDSSIVKEIDDLTMKLTIKPTTDPQTGKKVEINETDKKQALRRLRGILKEHMLRRTVQDANLNFPELEEKLVKLDLSSVQKHLYKNILLRNYEVLASTEFSLSRQSGKPKKPTEGLRVSLINILMHLRLVCDHPDLFYSRRRDFDEERKEYEEEVIKSSNKLRLLDKMIPKLLNEGHKLLIFSQFVLMLDILEEFLIFRNLEFERLDGNTRNIDRQRIIDNFNNGKSKIFLLSTRAGGLGINLTSSDTIIFTDSDFNPYRDIQAFCRAYRIGQKNKVMVYRLISKYTVEEKIVENATKKLMMGEMIMNPIDQSKSDKSVLESILRYGTKELFDNIDEKDAEDITDEKLDDLLKREAKPGEGSMKPKTNDLNDYYLSGFNFIDFNFTPILQNSSAVEETKENKYWETLLGNDYAEYEKQNTEALGKGRRLRNKTNNQNESGVTSDSEDSIDIEIPIEMSSSLDNSIMLNSDSEYDVSDFERRKKNRFMLSSEEEEEQEERDRVLHSIIALPEPLKEYLNCLGDVYDEIKDKTTEELMKLCGLDDGFRAKLVEFILKFGVFTSLNETMAQLRDYIAPFKNEISMPEYRVLKEYLRYFYACLLVEFPSQAICKFFFSISHPYAVRKRILGFVYMRSKLSYYRGKIDKFKITSKEYRKLFDKKHPLSHGFNTDSWTNSDDFCLCDGINRYGMDAWPKIVQDIRLWDHSEPKTWTSDKVWRLIFRKIEGREVQSDEEIQAIEFVHEYLKIRGQMLMDFLIQEKEKKKRRDSII